MRCVACGYVKTKILSTRHQASTGFILRRHACLKCSTRFSTEEHPINADAELETKLTQAILELRDKGFASVGIAAKLDLTIHQVDYRLRKHRQRGEPDQSPHLKEPSP